MDFSPITLYIIRLSLWPVVYFQDPTGQRRRPYASHGAKLKGLMMMTGQRDKAKEVEFGDSPNQELNKIIRFKERRVQKLLCVSQRRLQDVYTVYTTKGSVLAYKI